MSETVTDTARVYTTRYTKYDEVERTHVQKTVVLTGVEGFKQVIEKITMSLYAQADDVTASAMVTAEVDGVDTKLCEFTAKGSTVSAKTADVNFEVAAGKTVTLRYHLKTSNSATKAVMKLPSYTFSKVEIVKPDPVPEPEPEPEPEPDVPCIVVIETASEAAADALVKAITTAGYISGDVISIYKEAVEGQ